MERTTYKELAESWGAVASAILIMYEDNPGRSPAMAEYYGTLAAHYANLELIEEMK